MKIRRRSLLVALVLAGPGLSQLAPAHAGSPDPPLFEMPFLCGQDWQVATHTDHGDNDNATDWNQGSGSDDLGKPVLATYSGIATIYPMPAAGRADEAPVDGPAGPYGPSGAGNYIVIDHGDGWSTRYLHLGIFTTAGGPVRRGQQIGTVGMSGTTSSHLHYEQQYNGIDQLVSFHARPIELTYVYNGPTYRSHNCSDGIGAVRDVNGSARWYLDYDRDGASDRSVSYGLSSDRMVSGDWDGDGGNGIGVYRPAEGTWYLDRNVDGSSDELVRYGARRDLPLAGDWNADGRADIGVYRRSEGTFMLDTGRNGSTNIRVTYGTRGDVPVVGDWDGDGEDTVGVFRPGNNTWYLDNGNDGHSDVIVAYGRGSDTPVVGDWDGDGADSIGVFRPATGTWYLDQDNDGTAEGIITYGVAGDLAIAGDWRSP